MHLWEQYSIVYITEDSSQTKNIYSMSKLSNKTKLKHIEAIINSCETYDQALTCFSFLNFFHENDLKNRMEVYSFIQTKVYAMRKTDLDEHKREMEKILNS